MDRIWTSIIKVTGAVGVVAFLIYTLLNYIYSDQIIKLFGSDRLFLLTFIIIVAILIIFFAAIVVSKKDIKTSSKSSNPHVTYNDKSSHHGDNNF